MAQVFPNGWDALAVSGAAQREIETLEMLRRDLPDSYAVYHGVHWTQLHKGFAIFGEADFVVVGPSGRVLVIEQKSGLLEETPDGLAKAYGTTRKSVSVQLARTIAGMHGRFKTAFGTMRYRLEELLYCPDYRVKQPEIAGVNPARIVDSERRAALPSIIQAILPADEARLACADRIHAFLGDELSLTPDVGATIGEAARLVTRISGGLATWARAIECRPFRLRVIGTAGSGKTQLALRVLEDASKAGQRALYLCFNRPLADHLCRIAPPGATVLTYHKLCQQAAARDGETIDFAGDGVFEKLERALADWQPDDAERFDTIVVDEGQDFLQAWVAPIGRLLRDGGKWWWLEDPMQNLYLRDGVDLPGWVEVRATSNYRSPRDIVRFVGALAGAPMGFEAASPFDGSDVGLMTYAGANAAHTTRQAIDAALAAGFALSDIALLSFHGREKSLFTVLDRLGRHALRSFTGAYDAHGAPIYRDGELRFDSVFRFKGQSAPCVILTEVDFEHFDEIALRRLFVGATRATVKLIVVMSDRAAGMLMERVG
ncbi:MULTISPECIES: ATP-binding domain-containing protein [unclassified Burkholderia]|uniref:ATP-binding domain-containing protein n=1 Tax=unclassified Burkholderia TaxID=2613784 RepID=UPI000F57B84C|nr:MULTISPECIES: ATP-binding domain-containing protein [unclassified Burkholderia]RQR46244.1 nuclease [Burkholderia sp. Bp9131]RQR78594.1 nuclease [Burkholderia sp. Bp9015]RQR81653.1 nuclease [Burkholderia sp. Bp9011]RQR91353.1 nuclease [Burkholderia sp. Bp9010]RQS75769.1 nuclease [Burkholderia sp. Bp8977]